MPSSVQHPAYVPVGGEFDQGRPVSIPLHRQRDAQGVVPQRNRRKEWWWQPGPVDSFWCCFSVSCGVVYIASATVIMGILVLSSQVWLVAAGLPALQAEYASECGGDAATLRKCTDLADAIESVNEVLSANLVPTLLIWVVNVVSAAIGLWAVLYSNVRAVKIFLRSQALVFLMSHVNAAIQTIASAESKTSDEWISFVFILLIGLFFGMYQLKVIWSYQMLLLSRSRRNPVSSSAHDEAAGGMIELDGSSQVV